MSNNDDYDPWWCVKRDTKKQVEENETVQDDATPTRNEGNTPFAAATVSTRVEPLHGQDASGKVQEAFRQSDALGNLSRAGVTSSETSDQAMWMKALASQGQEETTHLLIPCQCRGSNALTHQDEDMFMEAFVDISPPNSAQPVCCIHNGPIGDECSLITCTNPTGCHTVCNNCIKHLQLSQGVQEIPCFLCPEEEGRGTWIVPANEILVVHDNAASHHGHSSFDSMAIASVHSTTRAMNSASGHTLCRTIASSSNNGLTMSSDSYRRLLEDTTTHHEELEGDGKAQKSPNETVFVGACADAEVAFDVGHEEMSVSPLVSPESDSSSIPEPLRQGLPMAPLLLVRPCAVVEVESPPTPGMIQPYHAVIGDKTACKPPRLTAATLTLRRVKIWYRENRERYGPANADRLYRNAMNIYFREMTRQFGPYFPSTRLAQEETILVFCGPPERPLVKPGRVKTPCCYQHKADKQKKNGMRYGIAKLPNATLEYFRSKGGPPALGTQVRDYYTKLEHRTDLSARERKTFVLYLEFSQALLNQANEGCPIALAGLEKTNLNTSLRDLWKEMTSQ